MHEKKFVQPPRPQRLFFHLFGMIVLFLNKLRYGLRGYREPRPFAPTEIEKAIAYDRSVVTNWLNALKEYCGQTAQGKTVLELGPGADLGPALFLLDSGAKRYVTIDSNRLIDQTPRTFYDELLKTLTNRTKLERELAATLSGQDDRIKYLVDPHFDLSKLHSEQIDFVVSQAAFEHFSDVGRTIEQLSEMVQPGTILVAEIDLMTHTGALRTRDPLNIFRYSNIFYRLMKFSGIPNRVRPIEYKNFFEKYDWTNVQITPLQFLSSEYIKTVQPQLARPFRSEEAQMHVLSFLICATKS